MTYQSPKQKENSLIEHRLKQIAIAAYYPMKYEQFYKLYSEKFSGQVVSTETVSRALRSLEDKGELLKTYYGRRVVFYYE